MASPATRGATAAPALRVRRAPPLGVRRATAALLLALALLPSGCADDGSGPPSSSTLEVTYVDADGNGALERGPGEPLIDSTALAPRARLGWVLATLAQISDAHVRD